MSAPERSPGQGRYWYAWGYANFDRASDALESLYAGGEVSQGEKPAIASYAASKGGKTVTQYGITLEG